MAIWKRFVLVGLLWPALAAPGRAADVVDRIVAQVNGHILLQSDWEEEVAFEALLNAQPLDFISTAERKAALDRLIDQELLREQVRLTESAPGDVVAARLAEVRKLHPAAATDDGWRAVLQRYGLTPSALEKRLADDLQLMRLVEARLRPSIQVDSRAVESYYHDQFLPELQKAGEKEVPLQEVFNRIKDLLAEQKMNQLIASWLANLRSESRIQTPAEHTGEQKL